MVGNKSQFVHEWLLGYVMVWGASCDTIFLGGRCFDLTPVIGSWFLLVRVFLVAGAFGHGLEGLSLCMSWVQGKTVDIAG